MSEDFSSIDIDLLSAFLEESGESAESARAEIKSVGTFVDGVRERCEAGAPGEGSLNSADDLVDVWEENEAWALVIRDDIGADKSGTVEFSDAAVSQALVDADAMEAPSVVPFEETEILGLAPTSGFADDPVCTANGNFIHTETDVTFYGFAKSLDVVRIYNSLRSTRGRFGVGWSSLLDVNLEVSESTGFATVVLGDGGSAIFAATGDGKFRFNGRRGLRLTRTEEIFKLESAERSWVFDIDGVLTSGTVDRAPFSVSRSAGELVVVRCDVSGRSVRYNIDGDSGLVATAESSDGRTVSYLYEDGHCIQTSSSRGDRTYEIENGLVASIRDEDGVLLCRNSYDLDGKILSQTTPHGGESTYEYAANNTTKVQYQDGTVVNAFIHDDRGNLTTLFGADGAAQRTRWDDFDRPLQIQQRGGGRITFEYEPAGDENRLISRTDQLGRTETWEHDDVGRVSSRLDIAGETHFYSYQDSNTLPSEVTDPEGHVWAYEYDSFGNLVSVSDPDGFQTNIERNYDGLVTRVTKPPATSDSGRSSSNAIVVRQCEYDQVGRIHIDNDMFGADTIYEYDSRGYKASKRSDTEAQEFIYTQAGRLTSDSGNPNAACVTYGPAGEVATVETVTGGITQFRYDSYGRPTERVEPGGEVLRREFNNLGQTTSTTDETGCAVTATYDRDGNVLCLTDRDGYTQNFEYDKLQRPVRMTGPDGSSRSFTYHPNGQPVRVERNGSVQAFGYDRCGRLVKETDTDGGETCFTYTNAGRPLSMTTPNGRCYRLIYDLYGRPDTIIDESNNETNLAYNALSQVVSVRSGQEETQLSYDDAGRFEQWITGDQVGPQVTHTNDSIHVNTPNQNPWSLRWGTNGITSATDPSDVTSNFALDHQGAIKQVSTGNISTLASYDRLGNLTTTTDALGIETHLDLSPGRRVKCLTIGSTLERSFNYDDAGRIKDISGLNSQHPLITFDYDPFGQTQTVKTAAGVTAFSRNGSGLVTEVVDTHGSTSRYERNPDGFVTRHEGPGFTVDYHRSTCSGMSSITDSELGPVTLPEDDKQLDTAGRIAVDNAGRTIRYDQAGRLKEAVTPNGEHWEYRYNELGLLEQDKSNQHGTRKFTYDATGAVLTVTQNNQPLYDCSYDEAGRRTGERLANGTVREYVWDALDHLTEIIETVGTKTTRTEIAYSGIGRPETINSTRIGWDDGITNKPTQIGDNRYLRYGTKTLACTNNSNWTDGVGDDPYGLENNNDGLRLGYRGELTYNDLVFMGHRIYQPVTRSFLTRDPLPPVAGQNCFTSAYHYCYNDPINNIDPTGQRPLTIQEFEQHIERANQTPFSSFLPPLPFDPNGRPRPFDPLGPIRPYADAAEWFTDGISQGAQDFWNKEWTYDWGTGGAAVINLGYGAYKVYTGVSILRALPALAAIPVIGQIGAVPTALYGGYQVVTGGARFYRGGRQGYEVAQNPRCESECTTGDNVERLVKGVIPSPAGGLIDTLGGLF